MAGQSKIAARLVARWPQHFGAIENPEPSIKADGGHVLVVVVRHPRWSHPYFALTNRYRHGWHTLRVRRQGRYVIVTMAQLYPRGG